MSFKLARLRWAAAADVLRLLSVRRLQRTAFDPSLYLRVGQRVNLLAVQAFKSRDLPVFRQQNDHRLAALRAAVALRVAHRRFLARNLRRFR